MAAASRSLRVDGAQRGGEQAHDEGRGDEGLHDGHDPERAPKVDRRRVETDHEAVAEHDRRGAEREHHGDVEPARRAAGNGSGRETADRESDRCRRDGERQRVEDRVPGRDEQRRRLVAERAIEREPDPPWCVERPHDECRERRAEQERTPAEDGRERDASARTGARAALRSDASGVTSPARASSRDETETIRATATSWSSASAAAARRSKVRAASS